MYVWCAYVPQINCICEKGKKDTITDSSPLLRSKLKENLSDSIDSRRVMRLLTDTFISSILSIKNIYNHSSEKQNLQQQQREKSLPKVEMSEHDKKQTKFDGKQWMHCVECACLLFHRNETRVFVCAKKKIKAKHNGQQRKIKTILQQKQQQQQQTAKACQCEGWRGGRPMQPKRTIQPKQYIIA